MAAVPAEFATQIAQAITTASRAAPTNPMAAEFESLKRAIEEQKQLIEEQKRQVDEQRKVIARLQSERQVSRGHTYRGTRGGQGRWSDDDTEPRRDPEPRAASPSSRTSVSARADADEAERPLRRAFVVDRKGEPKVTLSREWVFLLLGGFEASEAVLGPHPARRERGLRA